MSRTHALRMTLALSALLLSAPASAKGDAKAGQGLHDKQCVSCHVKLVGGDGSGIYTRTPRKVGNLQSLAQRVTMCAGQINAGWFPEDEENVTAWLNQKYYKFK